MSTAPTTSPGIDDIVVRHAPGGVVVESRRRPAFITAFAVFCVCWDVGAIAFIVTTSPALMWFTVGVPAVVLTAMLVDLIVNHTSIRFENGVLHLERKPLPWPVRREHALVDVEQVFASDRDERVRDPNTTHVARPVLWLVDRRGERHVLIDRLADLEYGLAHAITEQLIASAPGR